MAAADSVKAEGWFGSFEVGGGEVNWGVGGVGVLAMVRELGI